MGHCFDLSEGNVTIPTFNAAVGGPIVTKKTSQPVAWHVQSGHIAFKNLPVKRDNNLITETDDPHPPPPLLETAMKFRSFRCNHLDSSPVVFFDSTNPLLN